MNSSIMKKNEIIGFFYGIVASLCYATMALFTKLASSVPTATIVFIRSTLSLLFLCVFFVIPKKVNLKTNKMHMHIARCAIGLIGMYCFIYSSKQLNLVDSVLLVNTSPLFIPIVVLIWFKTKIPFNRVLALVIGFLGVIAILKPSFTFFKPIGLVGLASGLFIGTAFVIVRRMSKTEPVERMLFYFFTGSILLSIIPLVMTWKPFYNNVLFLYLFLIGVFSFLFQFFITKAYSLAPATKVSALGYFAVVFSGILDWIVWNKITDIVTFIGILCVISACVFIHMKKDKISVSKEIAS